MTRFRRRLARLFNRPRERIAHVQAWRELRAAERKAQWFYATAIDQTERREAAGLMMRITAKKQLCGNPRAR